MLIVGLCLLPLGQGECLLPNLIGKFYEQQQHCDVVFQLQDGSTVQVTSHGQDWRGRHDGLFSQAHKMMLAVTSAVFEGMFFGPLADKGLREVGSPPDLLDWCPRDLLDCVLLKSLTVSSGPP